MGFSGYPVSRIDRSHHLQLSCKLYYHEPVVKIRMSRVLALPIFMLRIPSKLVLIVRCMSLRRPLASKQCAPFC